MPTDSASIVRLHDESIKQWRSVAPREVEAGADLASLIRAQHFCNFQLWNLEDEARRRELGDAHVAAAKRRIDERNQRRSDLIERIDETILAAVPSSTNVSAEQHSETAAMVIDRLSILALKVHNMRILAGGAGDRELAAECVRKLDILVEQRRDLAACFDRLLADCRAGRRFFKVYRQFKTYNDPRFASAPSRRYRGKP